MQAQHPGFSRTEVLAKLALLIIGHGCCPSFSQTNETEQAIRNLLLSPVQK